MANRVTKRVSFILIAVLVVVMASCAIVFGQNASGENAYAAWTGSGTGTAADPYQIGSRAELEKFRDIVNGSNGETQDTGACAILTADIDLYGSNSNKWTPIGSYDQKYNGHFDGDGHAIEYVYVASNESYQGLFGATGSGSVIEKLRVDGSADTDGAGTQALGGIVGYACGTIRNCVNEVNVQGDQENTIAVGGIAGVLDGGAVTRCASYNGNIGTSLSYVGGIVGQAKGTCSITDCYNLSFVGAKQNGAGGIVGGCATDSHVTIARCFCYNARIVCSSGKKGAIIGEEPTGENASISFENCYFYPFGEEVIYGSGERNETAGITQKTAEEFIGKYLFIAVLCIGIFAVGGHCRPSGGGNRAAVGHQRDRMLRDILPLRREGDVRCLVPR